jgi:hypothetical protein
MQTFKIKNVANNVVFTFHGCSVYVALKRASRHYFGKTPIDMLCDDDGVYTMIHSAADSYVLGRLAIVESRDRE